MHLEFIQSPLLKKINNIQHGFSHRHLEEKPYDEFRLRIRAVKQVHGNSYFSFRSILPEPRPEADAISTSLPATPIGIYTADCVPILLAACNATDAACSVLAIHAGWRGTAKKITEIATRAWLRELKWSGKKISHITAAFGPAIQKDSFEVEGDVVQAFPHCLEEGLAENIGQKNGREKFLLDLVAINRKQLQAASENLPLQIDLLPHCTFADAQNFHSFRRDREAAGRNLSFIVLSPSS